ncbi:MAG: hypothetical protein ACK58L_08850 [Planctomycetota bacterium]
MPVVPEFEGGHSLPEAMRTAASSATPGLAVAELPGQSVTVSDTPAESVPVIDGTVTTTPNKTAEPSDVPTPIDPAPSVVEAVDAGMAAAPVTLPTQSGSSESAVVTSSSADGATQQQDHASTQTESSETPVAATSNAAVSSEKTDVAMSGEGNRNSPTRHDSGVGGKPSGDTAARVSKTANSGSAGMVVKAPDSFSWKPVGNSSGNRPFQVAHIGEEGYRTLVLGSVGGKDPLSIELVDCLARHLHQNSIILGGFECTIVRTMNPDGDANGKLRNQKGEYVNSGFPKTLAEASKVSMAEPKFVLEQIERLKPQRIVHIRTVSSGVGVVATGFSSQTAAREAAEWMKFKMVMLPDKSAPGQLERYVSTSGVADMITIGIPESTPKEELWNLYGDIILNLLLAEDFATREIARKQ